MQAYCFALLAMQLVAFCTNYRTTLCVGLLNTFIGLHISQFQPAALALAVQDAGYCEWQVSVHVCLCVGHNRERCKNG